jgi:hypothetical protein
MFNPHLFGGSTPEGSISQELTPKLKRLIFLEITPKAPVFYL